MTITSAFEGLADYAAAQRTTGLIVVRDGRTLIERNWPLPPGSEEFTAGFVRGTTPDGALREDVASLQKSIVALLVAIAVDRGLLDVARPVAEIIGDGWSKAPRELERAVTIRHLMEMNSGLSAALAYEAPPDTRFFYNTPAYARLHRVLETVTGKPLDALTREWLTQPLGMADTEWLPRPADMAKFSGNRWGLVTSPRDLVRLGRFMLDGGCDPGGTRLISKAQFAALLSPTPTNPAYGRLWWLNGGAWAVDAYGTRSEGPAVPAAPSDLVLALGAEGRILGIVPSLQLIAVRTGRQPPDADFRREFWRRLLSALS